MRVARVPSPTTAPAPASATSTRPASELQPSCASRARDQTATPSRMTAPTTKNCGWSSPPPPSSSAAALGPPTGAEGERGAGGEEGQRERQVGDEASSQVDGEEAREQPCQQPRPAAPPRAPVQDRGGHDGHHRRERVLHARDRGDEGKVQGAGHGEEQGRDPGALADRRDAPRAAHPRPPVVHGLVGTDAEPPVLAEGRAQDDDDHRHRQPQQAREVDAGRGAVTGRSSATPWRRRNPERSTRACRRRSSRRCTGRDPRRRSLERS